MSSSSHNERIAAKRQQSCLDFIETTSTNIPTAKHYMKQAAFDLDRAVSLFYDAGSDALPSDDDDDADDGSDASDPDRIHTDDNAPNVSGVNAASPAANTEDDPISTIMDAAKETMPASASSSASFGGRGVSLNSSGASDRNDGENDDEPSTLEVRVVFYRDGFTAQETETDTEPEVRRRGVHSFSTSSSSSSSKSRSRLPPFRSYGENAQFIQDVKQNRVPAEFRRLDSRNRPVPVSILLDDRRSSDYPVELWKTQQQKKPTASFGGAGNTLGDISSGTSKNDTDKNNHNNTGIIAAILHRLLFLWTQLLATLHHLLRRAVPLQKHVVDPQKPTTNISLRISSRRERVEFNTDHTVEDLRRYCRVELCAEGEFELTAGFPPKAVRDGDGSLEEAGLLNSAVEVRVLSTDEDKRRR